MDILWFIPTHGHGRDLGAGTRPVCDTVSPAPAPSRPAVGSS